MDEYSLTYSMGVLDELAGALQPIAMSVEKMDPAQTNGIPTGVIRMEKDSGWEITCHVVPTHKDKVSTVFVQLIIPLTPPCPEHREALERYAVGCNGQFYMGTLLVVGDCLYLKYVIVLEPTISMEESHVQAAVFAFCQQAEVLASRALAVCRGDLTVERALSGENG